MRLDEATEAWRKSLGEVKPVETESRLSVEPLYTPRDADGDSYLESAGFPGQYPFTRGIYPSMYRGRLWTMRLYSGWGTADETNARFRYPIDHGQTGLRSSN